MSKDFSNFELEIIKKYLNSQSGSVLLFSNNSELKNSITFEKLQIFSSSNQNISDKIDILLSTDIFREEISKYNQKFDTIIIHDLFEEIKNSELFLKDLTTILTDKGTIICLISNFYNINNIINLLAGQLNPKQISGKLAFSCNLETINLFINKNNFHIDKIFRIKEEFLPEKINLDDSIIPSKLIDMIKKVPDTDTLQYVLMIGKGKSISSENLEFVSEFPKNYLFPKLQEFFEKFSEFEKSISDKDEIISGLEISIKEQKAYTKSAISEKDKLIQGHENSIKEQREYIKNLEEHIHNLESQLKKFKFWKK